jgi:hypothetical protein
MLQQKYLKYKKKYLKLKQEMYEYQTGGVNSEVDMFIYDLIKIFAEILNLTNSSIVKIEQNISLFLSFPTEHKNTLVKWQLDLNKQYENLLKLNNKSINFNNKLDVFRSCNKLFSKSKTETDNDWDSTFISGIKDIGNNTYKKILSDVQSSALYGLTVICNINGLSLDSTKNEEVQIIKYRYCKSNKR